jgi:DNA-binding NarL/FixJ family response regulator
MTTTRPRVVIADDHGIIRDALRSLLAKNYDVVALAADGRQLVDAVVAHRPDVVVADIDMPEVSGLTALRELQARSIPAKVVFLTMHDDVHVATEVLRAGGAGYVLKHSAATELHEAIQQALHGGRYLTPRLSSGVLDALVNTAPSHDLTPRQLEVLRLLAAGKRMKEIATELNLSTRTVESHKYEIMDALGLHSNAELVRYALDQGLLR